MSVLALRQPNLTYDIALAGTTKNRLNLRHGGLDNFWREEFGYGIECLTEGEAGQLHSAPSLDTIRNRLIEARRDIDLTRGEAVDCGESASTAEVNPQADDTPEAAGGGMIRVENWIRKPGAA